MGPGYPLTALLAVGLAALLLVASAGWGYGLAGGLLARARAPRGLAPLVAVALGMGALSYAAFALALAGWLRPWALALVALAGVARAARRLPAEARAARRGWRRARGRRPALLAAPLARWAAALMLLALAGALVGAVLPEIEYDALWYHLGFPARYLAAGRFLPLPCEHIAPYPHQLELLYAYPLAAGLAPAAKLLHYALGLLAAVAAAWLAARHVGRRWALPAAALALLAPTYLWEMTTAYVELQLALACTLAAALVLEWRRTRRPALLGLAGLLLGLALATKHLAFLVLAPLAAYLLVAPAATAGAARPLRTRVADVVRLVLPALAVAAPWYARAWALTGNPLFPMFYGVLARLGVPMWRWDAAQDAAWNAVMRRFGDGRSWPVLLTLPWRMTWDDMRFAGSVGPAGLLFLPPAALLWRRLSGGVRLLALLTLAYVLVWASPFGSFQTRFLVPIVPVAAVVAAGGLAALGALLRALAWRRAWTLVQALVVLVLLVQVPPLVTFADWRLGWIPNVVHNVRPTPLLTALGLRPVDRYMRTWLESYPAARWIDAHVPATGRVVWFGEAAQYYMRQDAMMDYSECARPGVWRSAPGAEAEAWRRLRAAGVTHLAWDKTRTDLDPARFAIRSPVFLRDYAETVYEDRVIQVLRLR
ncbi:MAG TPA: hypothetical protein VFS40_08875 [Gemmatimonadales bacterium]|nr:hypothetical protein [Gemmatimonadales bacterium]